MTVTNEINMNLDRQSAPPWINAVQGDAYTREIQINLFSGDGVWNVPADAQVLVRFQKPDGGGGEYDTLPDGTEASSISGNTITVVLAPQMLTAAGPVRVNVCLLREAAQINTFQILVNVHPNAGAQLAESEDYYNVSGFLPMPVNAAVGEYVCVTAVDEQGIVRGVETENVGNAVIDVPANQYFDLSGADSSVTRYSFSIVGPIKLGEYSRYRINKIGVMTEPGTVVRFALFEVLQNADGTGVLTKLATIGDAVADGVTGQAALAFEEGYYVDQPYTVIMALAQTPVICCHTVGEGITVEGLLTFEDAVLFDCENGTEISCGFTSGATTDPSEVWFSLCVSDIDYLTEQTLEQYIGDTAGHLKELDGKVEKILPGITALDNGKVLAVVDGVYALAAPAGTGGLPAVTANDAGKFLRVNSSGEWVAETIENAEEVCF